MKRFIKQVIELYRNAYGGLSNSAWMLAFIMFVNRAGSMVMPFLSVYLKEGLDFSLKDTGVLMSCFGLGAMGGSFLGGYLTDKLGQFKVQVGSLVVGGIGFLLVSQLSTFWTLAIGLFLLSCITESLRPANSASIASYSRPENITRVFSLNRMAINLGFSIGPALGGLLAAISFQALFIVDGLTCIGAGILFYFFFRKRQIRSALRKEQNLQNKHLKKSPYEDWRYIIFVIMVMCYAIAFFQLFMTLPLYYRDVYGLSEQAIGGLLALNGLIVFAIEMVLVYLIGQRWRIGKLIFWGTLLMGLAYMCLNLGYSPAILIFSMILLSFSEILAMPYMSTMAVNRSGEHSMGGYMGMYSLAYASAFVLAPFTGTRFVEIYGFDVFWWTLGGMSVLVATGFLWISQYLEKPVSVNNDSETEIDEVKTATSDL